MTARPSTAAPILAVLAIVLMTLGEYVGGYFWLGDYGASPSGQYVLRLYRYQWLIPFFKPAAAVEERLRGGKVELDLSTGLSPIDSIGGPLSSGIHQPPLGGFSCALASPSRRALR